MGNNCLLTTLVRGYKRVPDPPASMIPFNQSRSEKTVLKMNATPKIRSLVRNTSEIHHVHRHRRSK